MSHDEIVLGKRDRVLSSIKIDIAKWWASGHSDSDSFETSLSTFMFKNYKNATPGGKSGEVYHDTLAMVAKQPIYRLTLNKNTSVDVDCYDLLENFAPELDKHYDDVHSLPAWVQEKISVLMVLDPTKVNDEITGIGRRINKNIFWVYANGRDSREESKEESTSVA